MNPPHALPPEPGAQRPLVAILTLGCKLNQAESQAWGRRLQASGCDVIDRPVAADGYLINTCSVTHVADRKARRLIRAAKRLSPHAPVVVTGCYAEWAGAALAEETGADVVVANDAKSEAAATLLQALPAPGPAGARGGQPAGGRTRVFLKIHEGCDDVCAFCIVPAVRGRERARPMEEIVRDAQAAEAGGALEVVLTGTQPGAYGRDRSDGTTAAALLTRLLSETTLPRIRYSSIQPQDVSDELLAQWEDARPCRHFHLALQSGSDAVLRRMRRRYDAGGYLRAMERIRAAVPGAAITADVIVGFPGETADDFAETLAVCRRAEFADVHVFPYSPRPRTSGALLPDDIPPPLKRERLQAVEETVSASRERYRAGLAGSVAAVLIEGRREGAWRGLTDTYVPVVIPAEPGTDVEPVDLTNRLLPLRLGAMRAGALEGRMLP